MAIEKVKFDIKVFDNFIEIIPADGVKDNSIYEIKLSGIKPLNEGIFIGNPNFKFVTAMNPMYCSVLDVASLLDVVDISEDVLLYNIREASKYAKYIYETTFKNKKFNDKKIPFAVKEFTRYKAAKDCLLKIYMSMVTDNIVDGALGEVKFKTRTELPDIKKILDYLDKEIKKWLDAIRGYELEGRARMATAIKGYHHGGRNPLTSHERKTTPKRVPVSMDRGVY